MTADAVTTLPDGQEVRRITLRSRSMTAQLLTLGAIVQDLRIEGVDHPLVLGCDDIADYLGQARYMGAIVGRFANRIARARFPLDGAICQTDPNFLGRHTLHGGSEGLDLQIWRIDALAEDHALLSVTLPDGHMGFPGDLQIRARIALDDQALVFDLQAETDAPTPCSLAHHGYFNLDGGADIVGHRLWIDAAQYLPVDQDMIPLPGIAELAGTAFDFRQMREIGDTGYDHNFCLSRDSTAPRRVARLTGRSGLSMSVITDAPGLQLYDGRHFADQPGLQGRRYGPRSGVALETQIWPDAPNRPDFPHSILRPGQTYRHHIRYGFSL